MKRGIAFPVELIRVNYMLFIACRCLRPACWRRAAVVRGNDNTLSVRIEKHLVCVETKTSFRS